ncbi:MAG: porphobilinogen synthase [Kofleriaceae bacterium]|nr:porphobilinogen synthase [Kofleriaceae bacterium]MCB9575177.1 porphobilinogen synthase [Kofleriaceae bacterium]
MNFPEYRPRRLRRTDALRRMIRETRLSVDDLVYPMFVVPGSGVAKPIPSMPGQFNWSVDKAVDEAARAHDLGIPAVILFGIPERKDAVGSDAWNAGGVVQKAIRAIKKRCPELIVIADACFCEYTDHGHCGILHDGELDNDASLENLARLAVSYAKAGVDIVAPSGMLDGFVGACRESLDEEGFEQIAIMAYSAKYASGYYGPFRDAAQSAPQSGDRRGYQMDPGNAAEAAREVAMDVAEGADIIMVKPALAYLDIVRMVSDDTNMPIAAYAVSGEYAMIEAAAEKGWIDRERVVMETLLGIRRAGADMILTYHAPYAAELLAKGSRRA